MQLENTYVTKRDLFLINCIRDFHPNAAKFSYYLEYLIFHLPQRKLTASLEWCIKNKLTGEKFLEFVAMECHDSGLELIRHLTMRLEKEKTLRQLHVTDIQ